MSPRKIIIIAVIAIVAVSLTAVAISQYRTLLATGKLPKTT